MQARSNTPRSSCRRLLGTVALSATLAITGLAAEGLLWSPSALADVGATLDRPLFDRDNNVILIPFHGAIPRFQYDVADNGTRLVTNFSGAQANPDTPYKLGIFHPLVSRVEMTPGPEVGHVRVSIWLTQPGSLNVVPDTRRGLLRLQLGPAHMEAPVDLSTPVGPQPIGLVAGQAVLPRARMGDAGGIVQVTPSTPAPQPVVAAARYTAQPPVSAPAPAMPEPYPSTPPVGLGGMTASNPLPGTPASGEYIYRKAIPSANGRDVTEVLVRAGNRSNVGVDRNVDTDAVVVNVRPPEALPVDRPNGFERPLANEPWRQPVYRGESTFKPVAAVDSVVGFTLMSENAPKLGSNLSGAGSTLYGGQLSVPIGNTFNLRFGAESFAYAITSLQVPDAQMRRDEYFGDLALEFLPIRRPWVLATGVGYWARYMTSKSNVLAPPEPSILFQPTMLWHGPSLITRFYVPLGLDALALTADAEAAPYMFGLSDAVSTELGNMYGYQLALGLKYSTRHFSAALGYKHQGYGTFNGDLSDTRGGPELSLVWRF